MTPGPRTSDVEPELAPALQRIVGVAAPERVAPDGDGLARAAITEAAGIRRRRHFAGVAAAAAVVAAIAVPLALRPGSSTPVPAGPTVGSSVSVPVETPAVRATALVAAALPAPLGVAGSTGSNPVVRPYVVGGGYHGESGTVRLGSASEIRGLVDVLNLADGGRVLRLEPSGGPGSTVVQSADGGVVLRLPRAVGPTVADASGKRFAMLDLSAGSLTVRDERGTVLARAPAPGIRSIVGFAGDRVIVTNAEGSALWDLASATIAPGRANEPLTPQTPRQRPSC